MFDSDKVVRVEPTGWEWTCPDCSTVYILSRSEYEPYFPVTCDNCEHEFETESY